MGKLSGSSCAVSRVVGKNSASSAAARPTSAPAWITGVNPHTSANEPMAAAAMAPVPKMYPRVSPEARALRPGSRA